MLDENVLAQIFEASLSGNMIRINEAQAYIQNNCLQPNYCVSLMRLGANSSFSLQIRQSAVTNLKNTVEIYWQGNQQGRLSDQEKSVLRSSVLDALIRSIDDHIAIVKQYKQIIGIIIQHDYPAVWPEFLDSVVNRLASSQNASEIQSCLFALEKVFGKYELEIDNREIIDHLLIKSIVVLQNLAGQMVQNNSEAVAPLLKSILKIYFMSINISFPKILSECDTFQNWMVIIKLILSFEIPSSVQQLPAPHSHPFWKNKKWCFKIIIKILHKYCFKTNTDKVIEQVSNLFLSKYSVSFIESVIEVLFNQYQKGQYVSPIVLNNSLLFIFYAFRHDITFNALHQILEKIALDICVPLLSTTPEDLSIYTNDPEDYIRKDEDTSIIINKNAAVLIIKEVCKITNPNKEPYLEYVLSLIVNCLDKGINPRTNESISIAQKEGLFYLLGIIRDQVYEQSQLTSELENIISSFITRELSSEVGILRARACWLIGRYGGVEFKNFSNLTSIITGLSSCMIQGDLVVRVKASIALQFYIDQDGVKDLVRAGLQDMLGIYIKLMTIIDNENLVSALECIVENFTTEITPYAFDLANHLTNAFYKYKEKDQDDDQGCEDGELPAAGCLQAIIQILESPLDKSIYQKMEEAYLYKLIIDCLTDKDFHYIEEGFSILNLLLFNSSQISNQLWIFYPFMCYSILGFPSQFNINSLQSPLNIQLFSILTNQTNLSRKHWVESLDSIVGPMKNFFQKGKNVVLNEKDPFSQSLIELLLETVKLTYNNQNEFNEVDQMLATSLLIGLIENMAPSSIDHLLPDIIKASVERISNTKCKPLKVVNIEVVAISLFYNPSLTLSIMENLQCVGGYLLEYFGLLNYFKSDFDKQRMLYGLASIFTLNANQLPATIIDSIQGLAQYLVKLAVEIVQLRQRGDQEEFDEDEQAEVEVQKFHQQLIQQFNNGDNINNQEVQDDDDDDENDEDYEENVEFKSKVTPTYTSPLELNDELLYFENVLAGITDRDNFLYNKLIGSLNTDETQQLQTCFSFAKNNLNIQTQACR